MNSCCSERRASSQIKAIDLNDQMKRGDAKIHSRMHLTHTLRIILILQVREDWSVYGPQKVLDMIFIINMPLTRSGFLTRGSRFGFPCPSPKRKWDVA